MKIESIVPVTGNNIEKNEKAFVTLSVKEGLFCEEISDNTKRI